MRPSREQRAIAVALRWYPASWRRRHGADAALLASALLGDGVPWWSIALNFLGGATRERVVRRPSVRVGTAMAALAIGVGAVPLALLTSLTPASASSTNVVIVISKPSDAAHQLTSAFSAHHLTLTVIERAVPAKFVGTILSVTTNGASPNGRVISEVRGACPNGHSVCVNGVVVPRHFSGHAYITIGRARS